ncbi:methylated-DNA--[protein]-cysteine S-methyltransferase [Nocardia huaxiensis]|uniref:methylated-DNA--[protein]-cysteine S-methyltransferase n=1 Tax=Nocardia huaxiensis TaxID=2755382 RepID=A0A7D6ZX57_9NOCA|nr:methylated-DNA--[protein]-cysteine S-methyltransferase [Nocardia huaxiensis]QLY30769.1 methylated-DNA--[protein]-cysteine S-methyltransferase [Nocardia huaxiensis]UFS94264.1 methylated-DNA--[protein]-cysteine S-methyltransferase [Nocardia huaxiensis]
MSAPPRPHASAALFDTAIGACAIAWSATGVVRFALPEPVRSATRTHILRRHRMLDFREAVPTPAITRAIEKIQAHLTGELDDLRWIPLDTSAINDFDRAVYTIARAIPPGHTLSYGAVADRIGAPGAAQAVGQSLGRNPIPLIVPCHRVLAADHALHGFSAPGGINTKLRLLEIERTPGFGEPTLF